MNIHITAPAGPAQATGTADGCGVIRVTGGRTLRTEAIEVSGDGAVALPLLAAAAATRRRVSLTRVPGSQEAKTVIGLIEACGWNVTRAGTRVDLSAEHLGGDYHPDAALGAAADLAGSHYLLSALLGAFGRAELPYPGGSTLLERSMDLVFKVYDRFGDTVHEHQDGYRVTAGPRAPRNVEISLSYPDRSATIAALLRAASLDSSTVTIHNPDRSAATNAVFAALVETGMIGTRAADAGSISLGPGRRRSGSVWAVPGNALEATVLACALLATAGAGQVTGIDARDLHDFASIVSDAGLYVDPDRDRVHVRTVTRYRDRPWAGIRASTGLGRRTLSSDIEPLLMTLALATPGSHKLENRVDPGRHPSLIPQLRALGAQITETSACCAAFTGPQNLHGATVHATDAMNATALLIASLSARGTTTITGAEHLDELYDDLPSALAALGARLELPEARE